MSESVHRKRIPVQADKRPSQGVSSSLGVRKCLQGVKPTGAQPSLREGSQGRHRSETRKVRCHRDQTRPVTQLLGDVGDCLIPHRDQEQVRFRQWSVGANQRAEAGIT